MKKILLVLLAAIMALAVIGCSNALPAPSQSPAVTLQPPSTVPGTPKVNPTVIPTESIVTPNPTPFPKNSGAPTVSPVVMP
jgi:hypothetical protein